MYYVLVILKNIVQYTKRNRNITLIGITSKKNSLLYKSSDLKFLLPTVVEAGPGNYIPTSSTTIQLCFGDALAISTIKRRNFSKYDFKKFHPSGSLGAKLKTVGELMYRGKNIPTINENSNIKNALEVLNKKNLGDISSMSVKQLQVFFDNLKLNNKEEKIADQILKEINQRLSFLNNVGLGIYH